MVTTDMCAQEQCFIIFAQRHRNTQKKSNNNNDDDDIKWYKNEHTLILSHCEPEHKYLGKRTPTNANTTIHTDRFLFRKKKKWRVYSHRKVFVFRVLLIFISCRIAEYFFLLLLRLLLFVIVSVATFTAKDDEDARKSAVSPSFELYLNFEQCFLSAFVVAAVIVVASQFSAIVEWMQCCVWW